MSQSKIAGTRIGFLNAETAALKEKTALLKEKTALLKEKTTLLKEKTTLIKLVDSERKKRRQIEKILENRRYKEDCSICMNAKSDTAFIPCGHKNVCHKCAPKLKKCPICRGPVRSILKIYD